MQRAIVILACVAAVLGALAIRVVLEGRAALAAGDTAAAQQRPIEAIRAYETAARWYLPLAPHVDDAYGRLRALASDAKQVPGVQLAAWRAIRGAARATRTLWTPHADDARDADAAIATLSAQAPEAATQAPAWHAERLARDPRPDTTAVVLAGVGILVWLGGALMLVRRGLDPAGHWVRRPAIGAGAAIVLGLVCWAVGLYNA